MALGRVMFLVCALALTLAGCGGGESEPRFVVGAVEDAAKHGDPDAKMELARRAGYRAIVLSSVWTPPLTAPTATELAALQPRSPLPRKPGSGRSWRSTPSAR